MMLCLGGSESLQSDDGKKEKNKRKKYLLSITNAKPLVINS